MTATTEQTTATTTTAPPTQTTGSASVDAKSAASVSAALYGSGQTDFAKEPQAEPTADAAKTDSDKTEVPEGAPETYEFKPVAGRQFDNDVLKTYGEVAKELNLSQKSAQMVLDKMGPKMAERQAAQLEAIATEWASTSRDDKEFGGDNLAANLAVAKKALDTFGTPELRSLLNESRLGNHPELIRFFYRAGKSISEDAFVGSSDGAGAAKGKPMDFASQASALYGNQSK